MEHRELLSGQSRGLLPTLMRGVLRVGSAGYSAASRVRRWQFDSGRLPIHQAGVPVISVGNLTTGGTGKTPIVADLCRRIRALDRRVAIISRGYGAADSGINDEALELAERLPDVPHVQHANRVEAARIAVEELAAEVLVMDDGFQHRWLHRDLDILVIDATCPFGFGYMLPRGYLREPVSSLRRADLVLLSRSDQVSEERRATIRKTIVRIKPDLLCLETVHQPSMLVALDGSQHPVNWLEGRSVIAVSAIGNPDAFERTLTGCGANVCLRIDFPDHDRFDRPARLKLIEEVSKWKSAVDAVVCTHKDFVKLATDSIAGVPLRCLRIELAFTTSERGLMDAIQKCIESSVAHD